MEQLDALKEKRKNPHAHPEQEPVFIGGMTPSLFLRKLFDSAVDAALPYDNMANFLPQDRTGKLVVIGAGKAAASMAQALEERWQGPLQGVVVTRYQHGARAVLLKSWKPPIRCLTTKAKRSPSES